MMSDSQHWWNKGFLKGKEEAAKEIAELQAHAGKLEEGYESYRQTSSRLAKHVVALEDERDEERKRAAGAEVLRSACYEDFTVALRESITYQSKCRTLEAELSSIRKVVVDAPHNNYCAARLGRPDPCDCWKSRLPAPGQPAPQPPVDISDEKKCGGINESYHSGM